jgi:hypothetical protein
MRPHMLVGTLETHHTYFGHLTYYGPSEMAAKLREDTVSDFIIE